jgi:hypothetical protein
MTPTQQKVSDNTVQNSRSNRPDADEAQLRRDIEALAQRFHSDASILAWNTYFDELIQRVAGRHLRWD